MIITLSGENAFTLQTKLKEITHAFIEKYGDFGLERINAEEIPYSRIAENVQAVPFLADKRLLIIYSPSSSKELSEHIKTVLPSVGDETDIVFVQTKFDKRSVLYKTLKKETDFQEFNELDEIGLARWAVSYIAERAGTITPGDTRYLIQRIGINQLRLGNEIDKLLNLDAMITRQTIDLLTEQTPQSTIFQLLDAALTGNIKQAMALYQDQRRQKVEPQAILALLSWQLHVLAVTKAANNISVEQIAKDARINPFVVRKAVQLTKNLTVGELKSLIRRTLQLDMRLKRESIDADDAMQNLLLTIS